MAEVHPDPQVQRDGFVPPELLAIVHFQAADIPHEQSNLNDERRCHLIDLTDARQMHQQMAAFALHQRQQVPLVVRALHKLRFPVPVVESPLYHDSTLLDADAFRYPTSAVLAAPADTDASCDCTEGTSRADLRDGDPRRRADRCVRS